MAQDNAINQTATQETTRDLDPNVRQRMASDPDSSVWVSASAGTGKTKVLTDRVLRLLMPRSEGIPGTPPHKILCLTFTKAGASEMTLRLNKTLGNWAVWPDERLEEELKELLGRAPSQNDKQAARRLFAQVVDTPGGLKIMTIHALCQSVLGRFPLEAGIAPGFTPLEEEAENLLQDALNRTLSNPPEPVASALDLIFRYTNEEQFTALLKGMVAERYRLGQLLRQHFGIDGLYTAICTYLDVQPGQAPEDILLESCQDAALDKDALQDAARAMGDYGTPKTDRPRAAIIADFLQKDPAERTVMFGAYVNVFLTQKHGLRDKPITANVEKRASGTLAVIESEALRLQDVLNRQKSALCAQLTRDLLLLGESILQEYQNLKARQNALDFDDLILKTLDLLKLDNKGARWVMYKLDQGLDHILIDEAQDTNPEQWRIIEALADEFFSGQGARDDITRTLFTVGDEKQSIYSFQRASPEEFTRMRGDFEIKINSADALFEEVDLDISFRSVKSVLDSVDAVFTDWGAKHKSFRTLTKGQAGHVELWPLFETEKDKDDNPWSPPVGIRERQSGAAKCAAFVADRIKEWLESGETLPSHGRPVKPGDIMILMRTRNAFTAQLTRALKQRNIPVSGLDRMLLGEQLAVQDLMAAANFALMPADDLSLACLLKSPLIGWNDERLYQIAIEREGTLWNAVKQQETPEASYLQSLIALAGVAHPYDFFSHILHTTCPAHPHSGLQAIKARLGEDALDPLEEFLNAALRYERDHIPGLQGFAHYFDNHQREIKRELQEAGGEVRIMTVHGAKGLQAPIVILPDTTLTGAARKQDRLVWPAHNIHKTNRSVPLWSPREDTDCNGFTEAYQSAKARLDEEYRRLLYVAMTRAEDRLYVTGYKGEKSILPDSWYYSVENGLKSTDGVEQTPDGLKLTNPQTRDTGDQEQESATQPPENIEIPAWLYSPAPEEPDPPAPLIPSRPSREDEPAALSPLQPDDQCRFRRGNITHKLLQFLPDLTPEKRRAAAEKYIAENAADLEAALQAQIAAETIAVLEHPDFAEIFGPGAMAEVPISGLLPDKRLVSGQIDRLIITDQSVLIVDFKTNHPPPKDPSGVPEIYRRQMQAYHDVLKLIYPGQIIRCALLWTDGPRLMELSSFTS